MQAKKMQQMKKDGKGNTNTSNGEQVKKKSTLADRQKAKKNQTSLKVQIFRKTIDDLIASDTQYAVEIEQIQTVLVWLCNQDGLEWDDYIMQHGISKNDDRNLEMIALLQKNGFSCTLQMKKNKLYAEFTLPHPFTESQHLHHGILLVALICTG